MKKQTVTEELEEVCGEVCDKICKYAAEAEDEEKLIAEYCDKCPLNRL